MSNWLSRENFEIATMVAKSEPRGPGGQDHLCVVAGRLPDGGVKAAFVAYPFYFDPQILNADGSIRRSRYGFTLTLERDEPGRSSILKIRNLGGWDGSFPRRPVDAALALLATVNERPAEQIAVTPSLSGKEDTIGAIVGHLIVPDGPTIVTAEAHSANESYAVTYQNVPYDALASAALASTLGAFSRSEP